MAKRLARKGPGEILTALFGVGALAMAGGLSAARAATDSTATVNQVNTALEKTLDKLNNKPQIGPMAAAAINGRLRAFVADTPTVGQVKFAPVGQDPFGSVQANIANVGTAVAGAYKTSPDFAPFAGGKFLAVADQVQVTIGAVAVIPNPKVVTPSNKM